MYKMIWESTRLEEELLGGAPGRYGLSRGWELNLETQVGVFLEKGGKIWWLKKCSNYLASNSQYNIIKGTLFQWWLLSHKFFK